MEKHHKGNPMSVYNYTGLPTLLPNDSFNVEYRLDGGPNGDGMGWRAWQYNDRTGLPNINNLAWGVVMHSAETAWLPGYSGGVHPHFDYRPAPESRWVQRVRLDRQAGTLRGASTIENGLKVPTNRALVHQIEINAYSAWWIAEQYGPPRIAVRDLPDIDLENIAVFIAWHNEVYGSLPVWYPKPGGNRSHPMPHATWIPPDGQRGWGICDHATAPDDSTHWDTDDIDRPRIMTLVNGLSAPPPPPIIPDMAHRLGGTNRYDTAALASQESFPTATKAYIANGRSQPDLAVAAALSAHFGDGPVLFVEQNRVPNETRDELIRLGISDSDNVWIVGSTGVVSASVEAELDQIVST